MEASRPVAGWMHESQRESYPPGTRGPPLSGQPLQPQSVHTTLLLQRQPVPNQPVYYSSQTGDNVSTRVRSDRPSSRGWGWDGRQTQPVENIHALSIQSGLAGPARGTIPDTAASSTTRFHPDPNRPPLSSTYSQSQGYLDSPYYPQPSSQVSAVELLSDQVANLESRLNRVNDTLVSERIENVRDRLDFTSYLLQITSWIGAGRSKSSLINSNRASLTRALQVRNLPSCRRCKKRFLARAQICDKSTKRSWRLML